LFGLGEGAILPVIPLTVLELGASVPMTALLVALIGVGSLASSIPASLITMHRGERWATVAGALWCALAMALCGWSGHLRVFALGSFMIGIFIGPFIAAMAIHRFGLVGAYAIGIAALLVSCAVAARMPDLALPATGADPDRMAARPEAPTILSTLRDNRHVFITLGFGMLLVSAVRTTRQTAIPLWADHLALEPSVDQMGRRWVVVPSMRIMGAGLLAMPFTHDARSLLLVAMAIGFGNGIGSGMMMTLGADHSPRTGHALPGRVAVAGRPGSHQRAGVIAAVGGHAHVGCRHCGDRTGGISRSRSARLLDSPVTARARRKDR